jgi:YbbR domain-containing protein
MKELLFRNLSLKILSLFFAVSLWLFVNLKATAENTLQVPVVWKNVPDSLVITNEVNDSIRVRVTGPRRILSNLEPRRLPVTLDLSGARVGLSTYQVNEKMIHLPPGLTAAVLAPDTIQFKFEPTVKKGMEVRPALKGKPAEGYAVAGVEVIPNRVEVAGAQSELQGVAHVDTEAIDVTERRQDFHARVKIAPAQPHVWPASGQGEVEVRVAIAEKVVQRLVKQVSVKIENARGVVRLEPPRVDVVLEGAAGKVDALRPEQIEASVVLPEEAPFPESLPVIIELPAEGIRTSCTPETVKVKVLDDGGFE